MRTTRALGLGLAILAGGGAAWAQEAGPRLTLQELLPQLDANGDMTLDRGEIPEAGRSAFEKLLTLGDTNQDGRLAADELRAMGQKLRALAPADPAERVRRLRAMDKDGDGRLSRAEFTGQAPLFDRLDIDQDGFLTKEEVDRLRPDRADSPPEAAKPEAPKRAAQTVAPDVLPPRVRAMDLNNDGAISREEFSGRAPLFGRLDTDGDGVLSPKEIRAGFAQIGKGQLKKLRKPAQP